ncbi:DUF4214 domain-containing protein [Aquihabitans daechungensis]|uniref:DUF4214 domain-containing protein n=1 Tax=Aquihabitans daechungensis TaxID=1052257 RepID=UPI003B9FA0A6
MKPRSIRSVLLAVAAGAAGLALVTTTGGPAGAATVSQTLSCSPGGNQSVSLITTAPATVTAGDTFTVVLAPGSAGKADGAEIKNMVTTFRAPTGSQIVPGSASTSGGSGTLGTVSTAISGQDVSIKTTGPVKNGASFTPPTLTFQLKATGAAGTVLRTTFRQSAGYTLTVAGSINVSCNAATPLTTLTSTAIEAAPTTTTTSTSTTSTAPTTTTTTIGGPPVITTSTWSPTGACGTLQSTTAPAHTTSVRVTAAGGPGGRSGSQAGSATVAGGTGGVAAGTFAATGGQTYSAIVGCAGADGGGFDNSATPGGYAPGGGTGRGSIIAGQSGASGGSGGGASAACLGAQCASSAVGSSPLVVAGGGGGGGVSNCNGTSSGAGGSGGSASSTTGGNGSGNSGANGASASSSGGAGGVNSTGGTAGGGSNGNGSGGAGVNVVGGGGGGGFVGGAAGASTSTGCKGAGGGGGGSSWVRVTGTSPAFTTSATPKVVLTFTIATPTACTADKAPFPTVQALVTQQYKDFKGATPTSSQNSQWVPGITNCSTTADALIVSLLPTDLTTLDDARLVRLYLAYFNRPPDPSGFAYWQRQLDNGKGLINAAKKFAESSEFKTKYGTVSNSAFIELVYQNVLGRASDPTGKSFWLTRLNNGTKNRGDVMINFSESSENVTKKRNHVQVFRMYRTMMAKFPSRTAYFELLNPILTSGKTLDDAAKAIRLSPGYDARV